MSGIQQDNFEYVDGDITKLLSGIYAQRGSAFGVGETNTVLEIPIWEGADRYWLHCDGRGTGLRRVLGGTYNSLGVALWFAVSSLPTTNNRVWIWQARSSANSELLTLALTTDGRIEVRDGAGTVIATTALPVITAGIEHKIQFQLVSGTGTASIEIRVDNVTVMSETTLTFAGSITQWFIGCNDTSFPDAGNSWYKSYAIYSLAGSYNNDWPIMSAVITLYPDADVTNTLTPRPRQKIEQGILNVPGSGSCLTCDRSSQLRINGDFTLEGFVRWTEIPIVGGQAHTLWGVWNETANHRSYRLTWTWDGISQGILKWEATTDGSTVITIFEEYFTPQVGVWYNLAVSRTATSLYVFVNGEQQGVTTTDANSYYNAGSDAYFTIGGLMAGTGSIVQANTSHNGMFDGFRFTRGVGRYTSNFTPTTVPYPTSSPADPYWADVQLMMGFDTSVANESSHPFTNVARGSCARLVPGDGDAAYQCIALQPYDDRYLESPLTAAQGVLTFTGMPAMGNTITLGPDTYLLTSLTPVNPYDVFIDSTLSLTIQHLVNAIINGPGEGVFYGPGTPANPVAYALIGPEPGVQLTAYAIDEGDAGNLINTSASTPGSASWSGPFLTGGQDIPGPSEYSIENPSIDVTGVRWISVLNRTYKSGVSASLQLSFVKNGFAANGADNPITDNAVYYTDTYETDPETGGAMTLDTLIDSAVRITRTS